MKNKDKNKHKDDLLLTTSSDQKINWFPGHMNKAMQEIKKRLKMVDVVLEVRDARSPMTTGNPSVDQLLKEKARLVIFNKSDLTTPEMIQRWREYYEQNNDFSFLFINQETADFKKIILNQASRIVEERRQQSNPDAAKKSTLKLMVLGLPNTGKSSLINTLAGRNASKVANKPGQTQRQLWVKVDPQTEVLDTPGVMPPHIERQEHGLWLAALHAIPDHIVSPEQSACYLVEHFIKLKSKSFFSAYDIKEETHELISALNQVATARGCLRKGGEFDYDRVYHIILQDFRSGRLGKTHLGVPPTIKN